MLQKHKSYFFGLQTYRQHNVLNIIWFSVRTENSKKSSNSTRILVLILVSVLYPIGFSRNLQIPLGYQYLLYSFLFGKNPWAPPLSFPIVQNCWSGYQNQNGIKWTSWSSVQIQDSFLCQSCPTCRARDRELKRTKVKSVWEICQLTTKNTNRMKCGCCLIAFILSWITLSVSEVRWPELLSLTLSQHRGSWGGGAFDEQLPHGQYPSAGTLSCPREPHSPAPFPWWPRGRPSI